MEYKNRCGCPRDMVDDELIETILGEGTPCAGTYGRCGRGQNQARMNRVRCARQERPETETKPGCGCRNRVETETKTGCGCGNRPEPEARPGCGCRNERETETRTGCGNRPEPETRPGCGCGNRPEPETRPGCGCRNERETETRTGCGCGNRPEPEARPGCGCGNRTERRCGRDEVIGRREDGGDGDCGRCARENDPLAAYPLAMAYTPDQEWRELFCEEEALGHGTLFRELDFPFYPACKSCR